MRRVAGRSPSLFSDVFDINTLFERIYINPEHYGFDKDKLKIPYIKSPDFTEPVGGLSPATDYMFYDDKYLSADTQAILGTYFYNQLERRYKLLEPDRNIRRGKCLSEDTLITTKIVLLLKDLSILVVFYSQHFIYALTQLAICLWHP